MSSSNKEIMSNAKDAILKNYKKFSAERQKEFRKIVAKRSRDPLWVRKTLRSMNKIDKLKKEQGEISTLCAQFDIDQMEEEEEEEETEGYIFVFLILNL